MRSENMKRAMKIVNEFIITILLAIVISVFVTSIGLFILSLYIAPIVIMVYYPSWLNLLFVIYYYLLSVMLVDSFLELRRLWVKRYGGGMVEEEIIKCPLCESEDVDIHNERVDDNFDGNHYDYMETYSSCNRCHFEFVSPDQSSLNLERRNDGRRDN